MTGLETKEGYNIVNFPPNGNKMCSLALHLFLHDTFKVIDLFIYTVMLANRADVVSVTAAKALLKASSNEDEKKAYQRTIDNEGAAARKLANYSTLLSRHLVTNTVDIFLWYLSGILKITMKKQANLPRSGETIRLDELFDFADRRDLIDYLVDRKVNELSYGGIKKIETYFLDKLGIEIFPDENSKKLLTVFIELRNIQTHNRGFVNRLFISRVGKIENFNFEIDKRFHVDFDTYGRLADNCANIAKNIDDAVSDKFGIRRKRYSTWNKSYDNLQIFIKSARTS
jgi:hypothetical protein